MKEKSQICAQRKDPRPVLTVWPCENVCISIKLVQHYHNATKKLSVVSFILIISVKEILRRYYNNQVGYFKCKIKFAHKSLQSFSEYLHIFINLLPKHSFHEKVNFLKSGHYSAWCTCVQYTAAAVS